MTAQIRQFANKTAALCLSKLAVVACVGVISLASTGPATAAAIDDVRDKVNDISKRVRTNIPNKIDRVRDDIQDIRDRLPAPLEDFGPELGDRETLAAIVESVQPVAELIRDRAAEYQSFDAEGFRYELSVAVENIANMQILIAGQPGPGLSRLQDKLYEAEPFVLFALSQTPLVELLDTTAGMTDELQTLGRISRAAIEYVEANHSAERVLQLAALNMSVAAPDYVSCTFVLENVSKEDIDDIKLSRLRAKQISGVAGLALRVLPKDQTIGVNVVGGATASVPNPLTAMTATIQKAGDKFHSVSDKWTKKYDDCEKDAVYSRLDEFLKAKGY